jgi:hypothetical protein
MVIAPCPDALNAHLYMTLSQKKNERIMLETYKGDLQIINEYQKERKGVWNAKGTDKRVSQATSAPSTKALMEVDQIWYPTC